MTNSKLLKKSVSVLASICVTFSSITEATGRKAVPDCDSVLNACLDYTKLLEKERDLYKNSFDKQQERIRELEGKQSDHPWYFWVILGAAGAIVVNGVRR